MAGNTAEIRKTLLLRCNRTLGWVTVHVAQFKGGHGRRGVKKFFLPERMLSSERMIVNDKCMSVR